MPNSMSAGTALRMGIAGLVLAASAELAEPAADEQDSAPAESAPTKQSAIAEYFRDWFKRSDAAKESQPHWMTPVVTVTPRLEQEFRYDQLWQYKPNNASVQDWGLNKGLELIPTERMRALIDRELERDPFLSRAELAVWMEMPQIEFDRRVGYAQCKDGRRQRRIGVELASRIVIALGRAPIDLDGC